MQVPTGSERFTFPNPQAANSPPSTPESSSSFQTSSPKYTTVPLQKRYGFYGPLLSPPEHIAPIAGNKFSYTPPLRQSSDSDSSESDDSDEEISSSDEEGPDIEFEAPEAPEAPLPPQLSDHPPPLRRSSTSARSLDSFSVDLVIEEITEDDIGYASDASIVHPSHCEEVTSDADQARAEPQSHLSDTSSDASSSASDGDASLLNGLGKLHCSARASLLAEQRAFETKRQEKYLRRKKRWSKGGNHKRSITESIGSASDTEDIVPLEDDDSFDVVGASARRLRRRTEGPDARPRRSLLFDDPPNEMEELKFLDGQAADGEVLDTDDELMLPGWMYPAMEVDVVEDSD